MRTLLAALALGLLGCGSSGDECMKPADCFNQPQANTCVVIKGRHRCVQGGCVPGAGSTCPVGSACTGMSDDGKLYCAAATTGGAADAR